MNEQVKNWYKDKKRLIRYLLLGLLAIATILAPWSGKAELGNFLFWAWLIILYEEGEFALSKRSFGKYKPWQLKLLAFLGSLALCILYLVYNYFVAR